MKGQTKKLMPAHMISRKFLLGTAVIAVVGMVANPVARGQGKDSLRTLKAHTTVRKSHALSVEKILSASRNKKTIPLFTYSNISSRDGKSYFGTMVGRNPFAQGKEKTRITTQLIPIII